MNSTFINPIELLSLQGFSSEEISREVIKKAKRILIAEIELSDEGFITFNNNLISHNDVEHYTSLLDSKENISFFCELLNFKELNSFLTIGSPYDLVEIAPDALSGKQKEIIEFFYSIILKQARVTVQKLYNNKKYDDIVLLLQWLNDDTDEQEFEPEILSVIQPLVSILREHLESLQEIAEKIERSESENLESENIRQIEFISKGIDKDLVLFLDQLGYEFSDRIVSLLINISVDYHNRLNKTASALICAEIAEKFTPTDSEIIQINRQNKQTFLAVIRASKQKEGSKYGVIFWIAFWVITGILRNVACNETTKVSKKIEDIKPQIHVSTLHKYALSMYDDIEFMGLPHAWLPSKEREPAISPNLEKEGKLQHSHFIKIQNLGNQSWYENQFILNRLLVLDNERINVRKVPQNTYRSHETGDSPFDSIFTKGNNRIKSRNKTDIIKLKNMTGFDQVVVFYKTEKMMPVKSIYIHKMDSSLCVLEEGYYGINVMSGLNWINNCISTENGTIGGFSTLLSFNQFYPVFVSVRKGKKKTYRCSVEFISPKEAIISDQKDNSLTVPLTGISTSLFFKRIVLSYIQS